MRQNKENFSSEISSPSLEISLNVSSKSRTIFSFMELSIVEDSDDVTANQASINPANSCSDFMSNHSDDGAMLFSLSHNLHQIRYPWSCDESI